MTPSSGGVSHPPEAEVVLIDETAPVTLIRENLEVNERGFDPSPAPVT